VILSNSARELDELLAAVRDPEADTLTAERQELRRYLLGPDEPTSIEQFNNAVCDLAEKAQIRNRGQESVAQALAAGSASGVPSQRTTPADETNDVVKG
jgi:hypothetical protein